MWPLESFEGSFDGFQAGGFQLASLPSPKRVGIGVWLRPRTRRLNKGRGKEKRMKIRGTRGTKRRRK
jgi:hypothetical protein